MKTKKPSKKEKPTKEELRKKNLDDYNKIPESEINPNGKEDFEKALERFFPPIEPKTKK